MTRLRQLAAWQPATLQFRARAASIRKQIARLEKESGGEHGGLEKADIDERHRGVRLISQ
jgi:hypothetical protein